MFSAEEAQKLTLHEDDKFIKQQLDKVEYKVSEACRKGLFSCAVEGVFSPTVRQQLRDLGYKLDFGTQFTVPYMRVHWKLEEELEW